MGTTRLAGFLHPAGPCAGHPGDEGEIGMFICIPVEESNVLASRVCPHFGSAPGFLIVDTETDSCRAIENANQHHGHGMCMPLASLQGERIDGMVVGGIGMGALNKLNAAGITVYQSEHATVGETLVAFKAGMLRPMQPGMACTQHGEHSHG
jgi:predicted Fe-Mo cluster-binding NifX family protein